MYAQDNSYTSYISAAYSTTNVVLVVVCGHKYRERLKSIQRTINMHVLTFTAVSASDDVLTGG